MYWFLLIHYIFLHTFSYPVAQPPCRRSDFPCQQPCRNACRFFYDIRRRAVQPRARAGGFKNRHALCEQTADDAAQYVATARRCQSRVAAFVDIDFRIG